MTRIAISPRSFRNTPGRHLELLEEVALETRYPSQDRHLSEEEMVELVRGCRALIVGVDPVTAAVLEAGPLEVVVKYGAGLDNIDLDAAARRGVRVRATPGANAPAVTELTLALLFALARHVTHHDRSARRGDWERRMGVELAGRRLGVIGYGEIGRRVAGLASAIGMEVAAHDPFVEELDPGVERLTLDDLLSTCDAVSLHVPLSGETRHMIDARALALMPPGSLLVNAARGGVVDETALADALESGKLGGAALDDLESEGSVRSRLLHLDHLIASPHAGAATVEAAERTGVAAVEALLEELR